MWGSRTRKAALGAAAVGGGGAAALAARLAVRRREVSWSPPERVLSHPYLSVEVLGHGDAPVVLLHPLSGSAEYFGSAFDELGDPGPLVVPDLLGFGSSPRPEDGYGPEQQVEAVVHSLDGLQIPGAALWVGHGLGAVVALRAAASHPTRVRAVVAISPLLYSNPESARRRLRRVTPLQFGGPLNRNLAEALYGGPGARSAVAAQAARLLRLNLPGGPRNGLEPSVSTYRQILEACVIEADGAAWFDQITTPVHIVLPVNDPVPDPVLLSELAARHRNVSLSLLPFGDHRLPLTHPDGCLAAIDRFRAVPTRG
ncbi:MAG: alpha/beta hydrolase [Candidatus Dormiibacterota bacterium]